MQQRERVNSGKNGACAARASVHQRTTSSPARQRNGKAGQAAQPANNGGRHERCRWIENRSAYGYNQCQEDTGKPGESQRYTPNSRFALNSEAAQERHPVFRPEAKEIAC